MKTILTPICVTRIMTGSIAQQNSPAKPDLPYYEIPDYSATYTPGAVAARVIDGLGFRYYWATEDLRPEDLKYQPTGVSSGEARTTEETIQHIYSLTNVILNTTKKLPTVSGALNTSLPFLSSSVFRRFKKSCEINSD